SVIAFAVIYPKAKEAEGKAYMAALEKRRKEFFNDQVRLTVADADHPTPTPTAEEQARGYMSFARCSELDIECHAAPAESERGAQLVLGACRGEREAVQLGLVPLKKIDGVKITASDLTSKSAAKIPSSAIQLSKVRNIMRKRGYSNRLDLCAQLLQPLSSLT